MSAAQLLDRLSLDADQVVTGDAISDDYSHDECVNVDPVMPAVVLKPRDAHEVSQILTLANELGVPVTCRGAGTGLSGAAIPEADGIRMVGNLVDPPEGEVPIGATVEPVFEDHDDAEPPFTLVQWRLAGS